MAKPLLVKKIGNILEIDGRYYQFTNKYGKRGEMIFEPINKTKFDAVVDKIVKKLEPVVQRRTILTDALGEIPLKNLEKMATALEKKKPKARERYGCVELVVAGEVIQLR